MNFTKMHGCGNDFVVVDGFAEAIPETRYADLAQAVCHRHFGVGADGLILVLPSERADFRMRIINADGSEAETCGNGIRCFAKFLYDHGKTDATELTVETGAGVGAVQLNVQDGRVATVRVDMGPPAFRRSEIPMTGPADEEVNRAPLTVEGRTFEITCVSMGNPHCVTFVENVREFPVTTLGPLFEKHEAFPRRTNTEFIEVLGRDEIRMRVWERGAGETWACGSGACASVVAGNRVGVLDRKAAVHLLGGDLEIDWAEDGRVYMTGPATEVFTAVWPLDE